MLIGFGGTFLFIFILFEVMGITEYVWPTVFPILASTFGIMVFVLIILGIACSASNRIPSDQAMVQQSFTQPTYPAYESPSTGAVYVIPLYCPHCTNKLELDSVEWIGPGELTCPSCYSVVQAGIRENF
jgi:hypothetical protein